MGSSTTRGFRHPLGILKHIPSQITGNYCTIYPSNALGTLVKKSTGQKRVGLFLDSQFYFIVLCPFLCQNYSVSIIIALYRWLLLIVVSVCSWYSATPSQMFYFGSKWIKSNSQLSLWYLHMMSVLEPPFRNDWGGDTGFVHVAWASDLLSLSLSRTSDNSLDNSSDNSQNNSVLIDWQGGEIPRAHSPRNPHVWKAIRAEATAFENL